MAPTPQLGFSELHDEVGVSSSGPASVDAGVEVCCRFQVLVPQQLPYQLVRARVAVEDDFGRHMTELMRGDFEFQMPQYCLLDSNFDRPLRSGRASECDEHRVGTRADHRGSNLVPIDPKPFSQRGRNLELDWFHCR